MIGRYRQRIFSNVFSHVMTYIYKSVVEILSQSLIGDSSCGHFLLKGVFSRLSGYEPR